MAWFCGSGLAVVAARCSGSVSIAIADTVIAVRIVASPRGANNVGVPTAVTNGVPKDGSITAIGNGNTGSGSKAVRTQEQPA